MSFQPYAQNTVKENHIPPRPRSDAKNRTQQVYVSADRTKRYRGQIEKVGEKHKSNKPTGQDNI